jgi:hypothetical protein
MQELIHEISQKLGVSDEMAEHAVHMMVDYLKTKLPEPIATQLESALFAGTHVEGTTAEGAPAESSSAETGIAGMVGKLFK